MPPPTYPGPHRPGPGESGPDRGLGPRGSWKGPTRIGGECPSRRRSPPGPRTGAPGTGLASREGRGGGAGEEEEERGPRPHFAPFLSYLFAQRPHLVLVQLFTLVQLLDPLVQLLGERLVVHSGPSPSPAASRPPPRPRAPQPRAPLHSPGAAAAASSQREGKEPGSATPHPAQAPRAAPGTRSPGDPCPPWPVRPRAPGVGEGRGEVRGFREAPAGRWAPAAAASRPPAGRSRFPCPFSLALSLPSLRVSVIARAFPPGKGEQAAPPGPGTRGGVQRPRVARRRNGPRGRGSRRFLALPFCIILFHFGSGPSAPGSSFTSFSLGILSPPYSPAVLSLSLSLSLFFLSALRRELVSLCLSSTT